MSTPSTSTSVTISSRRPTLSGGDMLGTSVGAGVSSPRPGAASLVGREVGCPRGVGVGKGVCSGVSCESSGIASKVTGASSGAGWVSGMASTAAGACSGAGWASGRVSMLCSGAGCSSTTRPFSFSSLGAQSSLVPWWAAAMPPSPSALSSGWCRSGESSSRAGARGARRRESRMGTSQRPLWFQTWGQPPKPHRVTVLPSPSTIVPGSTSPPIRGGASGGSSRIRPRRPKLPSAAALRGDRSSRHPRNEGGTAQRTTQGSATVRPTGVRYNLSARSGVDGRGHA